MKILVTGVKGQLGYDVCKELKRRGISFCAADIADFDLTDEAATHAYLLDCLPDAVIYCSAYTAVERAEDEPEKAYAVNVLGTRYIAAACREIGAKLLYISTDYVFPGKGDDFYEIDSPTGPISVYGTTKLQGELAVGACLERAFIVRTSWIFGKNGGNFVKTMLKLSETQKEVRVVCDQLGSPTYTADLAPLLCEMIVTEQFGTYHATNEGICSWAEFAAEIFRLAGKSTIVKPILSCEYPARANRPLNSRLSKRSLHQGGFAPLPHWRDALKRGLAELEL